MAKKKTRSRSKGRSEPKKIASGNSPNRAESVEVRRAAAIKRDGKTPVKSEQLAEAVRLGTNVDLSQAVVEINSRLRAGVQSVADYLVKTFFANDLEVLAYGPGASPGFVRLQERQDELDISYSHLRAILSAQKQRHDLQRKGHGDLVEQLPLTHQIRVLSVEEDQKVTLLEQARDQGWSVRQLDEAVKATRPEPKPTTFTPKRALGWLSRAEKLMRPAAEDGLAEALGQLEVKERTAARKRLDSQIKTLQKMRAACVK